MAGEPICESCRAACFFLSQLSLRANDWDGGIKPNITAEVLLLDERKGTEMKPDELFQQSPSSSPCPISQLLQSTGIAPVRMRGKSADTGDKRSPSLSPYLLNQLCEAGADVRHYITTVKVDTDVLP